MMAGLLYCIELEKGIFNAVYIAALKEGGEKPAPSPSAAAQKLPSVLKPSWAYTRDTYRIFTHCPFL